MKKIILILSVFTALTAGVYLFIRFNIFTTSLKYLAQSQLTITLSRPVKIEKVTWLPFNKIVLKKIQFEGFNCEEAVISVNLKKISKGLDSIESITLINPQVNIPAVKNIRMKKSGKKPVFLLPAKISIVSGTVTFSSTFTVNNINLEAVNKNNDYAVKSEATVTMRDKNNFSSQIKVAGMINKDSAVKLKGTIKNTNFNNLEKLSGDFNIRGSNGNFNLSGNLKSDDINLKLNSNIIYENLIIYSQVSGNINNLRKFAEHLLPGTTFQYLPENTVSFDGSYQLPDKKVTLNIKQNDIKIANGISLKNIKTNLIFCNNECIINSTATALSGDAILTGKIQKNNMDLSITFRDMKIQSDYVSITCALDLKILGTFNNPKIKGNIKTDDFSFKEKSSKNVSGKISWENGKGSIKMSGSNLAINIEGDKSKITKGNIKYDTTEILFSGKYNRINFNAKNVDISMFDKNITGFVGYIGGYIKNGAGGAGVSHPEIAASFSSDNITINGSTTSLTGEFFYDREGIYIKNLKMDGLNGEIKIKENWTAGSLNLSKCSSNIILPFIGVEQDIISGNITGKINWNGTTGNPKPYGTIAMTRGKLLKNIHYDLIATSFETKMSKFIITEFAVQQKASKTSMRLSGEIDKDRFNLILKLDKLTVSGKTITGDLELTGKKFARRAAGQTDDFIQLKIASDKLTIDKISEKLSAYGTYDGKKIDIRKLSWGDKVVGNADYFISSKYLSSDIDFSFDAENLHRNLQGPFVGKITIRGNINSPQVLASYYFDGKIYETAATGYGKFLINRDLLKVEETKLSIDGATAEISGIIDLNKKEFSGLNISLSNLKTDTLYGLLKSTYPLSGTWQIIELNVFGDLKDPQITADFFGKNMTVENRTVDSIDGKCSLKSKKILFSKGSIKWSDTNIKILPDSYIDFSKEIIFRIIAEIRNLKFPGITLFGGIDADGTLHKDTVKADISTTGLWINQKQLKNSKHYIEYSGGVMRFIPEMGKSTQITGTVDFSKPSEFSINNFSIFEKGKRLFYLNGSLTNDNIELTAEGENISMGDLLNLFDIKITAEGNTNFNLKATGSPGEPTITCLLSSTNGKIENLDFDIASIFFQLKENILELKHLKLSRAKLYSFEGEGTTPLPLTDAARKKLVNYPIDITFKVANGDLAILSSLTKSVKKVKGNFSTNVDIRGTLNKPDVKGNFTAKAEEIQLNNIFKKLTDVKCEIDFTGKIIKLKRMDALVDKEPISINGEMMIADGFNLGDFNFHLLTPQKDIPVTINDLNIKSGGAASLSNPSKAKINTDIKFFGSPENWNIDGYMKISSAKFTYPGEGSEEGSWEILKNATWNLKIIAGKDCWYERDFVSVEAKGELLLHGKGSEPLVTGRVEALRGELDYLGRNFTIIEAIFEAEKSNLFLSGRAEADTEIEIRREDVVAHQMTTEYIPDTIVITVPRGPLAEVKPHFSSKTNPQMDEQTAAQSAMGMQSTGQSQMLTAEDMSKRVDTFLTTPFVKSILKKTGFIDKFAIKRESPITPQPSGTQPSVLELYKGTKVQIGKSFTRGFSAGYGVKFDEFENKLSLKHEIELSYRMKSGIMLRTSQEIEKNESGESKFFLEKYWRFGTEGEKNKK